MIILWGGMIITLRGSKHEEKSEAVFILFGLCGVCHGGDDDSGAHVSCYL